MLLLHENVQVSLLTEEVIIYFVPRYAAVVHHKCGSHLLTPKNVQDCARRCNTIRQVLLLLPPEKNKSFLY